MLQRFSQYSRYFCLFFIKLRINGLFFLQKMALNGKRKRIHLLPIGKKSIINLNPKSTSTPFKKSVWRSRVFSTPGQYLKSPAHKNPNHSERNWFSPLLAVNQATAYQYDDPEFETDSECLCFHFQIWRCRFIWKRMVTW